ncbi:4-diphosphocytidyl-2-C-methyl-D-erythritol kinase [Palleronia marisminoris]|uniref:4-diphosphocytidyl-2-C-methyl-D-erythritol kinase n=1 Tax=Palleronia marisminoris TaxID=315423 RepID=A0A1Y5T167_9RHOB|nr:4-(cytidine 5'-diphospho)-2-C-methyl-D-erythritol kinase [Palleronia marisminoris]SFH13652.1 4-diphosphocytidyl-2-C-methyl-D-erythritol kinase [Palleronia marisminoris]SLN53641.1 4-diphosphocytidyl-2-C-methyl-D-erythritol kinase [Palleronia marisminoris]
MAAEAFAPAKINLALHVTGQRPDGYHLLDSLVVFADVGDTVSAEAADDWQLTVDGPFAAGLAPDPSNLVLQAARLTEGPPARLTLTKRLPIAAGLGGGSADAAATLQALNLLDGRAIPDDVLPIGADLPVCLAGQPARMRGIGEELSPLPDLPSACLVLVNAGRHVPTGRVYAATKVKNNAPLPDPVDWPDAPAFADWLARTRNDLEGPARELEPAVGVTLARIAETENCLLARMSGSGATCFGLYATEPEARAAADAILSQHPDWWVETSAIRR